MKKYLLEFIVFISGAVVMIVELVGSRILAPYMGTSIVVWTSLIGIILGSLSVGYWWGGRLADRGANYKQFSKILFISSLLVAYVVVLKFSILSLATSASGNLYLNAVIATVALFAPASVALGMVSPYAIRLKMKDVETSGATVGALYAVSTVGSIVGTFAAGFFLIAYFGSTNILLVLAGAQLFLSVIVYPVAWKRAGVVGAFLIAGAFVTQWFNVALAKSGLVQVDTPYNHLQIYDGVDNANGRPIRLLKIGHEDSSAVYLDGDDLVFGYTKFYRMASHFNPNINTALMIGGGAYTYPKDFLKQFPRATMDVVEIDPALKQIAAEYFDLITTPRLNIIHEDGRTFLNRITSNRYDVIYGDAFKSYSPPFQLSTKEAVRKMYDSLNENGLAIINIISSVEGEAGMFLRAEYATFSSVFPQVYLFPVTDSSDGQMVQNIMLVALKSNKEISWSNNEPEMMNYLSHRWDKDLPRDMEALADEYAPVENYLIKAGMAVVR